jgi:hypothetical protein
MKILITGCTAGQSSKRVLQRGDTFAGVLYENLNGLSNVSAELTAPLVGWNDDYIKSFDAVLVGVSSLTSITSNNLYPAFLTAGKALRAGNLYLFLDAPDPHKIQASLSSVYKGKSDLFKPFYENRKSFYSVAKDKSLTLEVRDFANYLYLEKWPTTLYPSMPWVDSGQICRHIPGAVEEDVVGVPIDSYLIDPYGRSKVQMDQPLYWVSENIKSKWTKLVQETLHHEVFPTKPSRSTTKEESAKITESAIGSLIPTYRSGEAWWSPQLPVSLNLGIPVATDWRLAGVLGEDWNYLPVNIEEMSNAERLGLALGQRSSYLDTLVSKEAATKIVLSALQK